MSKKFKQREIKLDRIYDSILVSKFINQVMRRGKKSAAQKIVYRAFDLIKKQSKKEPLEVFERAVEQVGPKVEVRPRRIGGATYQVPLEVNEKRRISLAMRWLVQAAQAKKGLAMEKKMAQEILDRQQSGAKATTVKELAEESCSQELLEKDLTESLYKNAVVIPQILMAEMNGLQTLYKRQEEV